MYTHSPTHTFSTIYLLFPIVIVLVLRMQNYWFTTKLSHSFKYAYKVSLAPQQLFLVVSNNVDAFLFHSF